VFTNDVEHPHL